MHSVTPQSWRPCALRVRFASVANRERYAQPAEYRASFMPTGLRFGVTFFVSLKQLRLAMPPFVSPNTNFFQHQLLGAACAAWSVQTAVAFLEGGQLWLSASVACLLFPSSSRFGSVRYWIDPVGHSELHDPDPALRAAFHALGRPASCGVFGSGTECHSGQPMLSEPLETQLKANEKDGGVDEEMTDPRAVQGACMVIEPRPPSSPDRHE
jgi:hypothetical protein